MVRILVSGFLNFSGCNQQNSGAVKFAIERWRQYNLFYWLLDVTQVKESTKPREVSADARDTRDPN